MSAPQASLLFRPFPSPLLHLPQCTLRRPNTSPLFAPLKPRLPRRLALSLRALHPDPVPEAVSNPSPIEIPSQELEAGPDAAAGSGVAVENRGPLMLLLMAVLDSMRRGLHRARTSKWLSWWPLWRQERIDMLIEMADKNPKDVALQNALLAELNNHCPELVIRRFEQRSHAVDSKGVAEYLKALVVTNALDDYLPDEKSGKASSLPTLLQDLKQRATGNEDEPFLNPGISEKQPLHVVMVDPKASNRSTRFAQELLSTILFTVVVGLMWVMGAAALQKYVGSLGGIGTSGVGSSATYAPKDMNKEIMPEKNVKTFKDVKGCDDAKQELEEVVDYLKNPTKFTRLGGKLPKGILLTGAPGTGKTLLAKAIAGEAGVPFFYRAGSEFEEMFVGVGARRVRSLFQSAKKKAPCIIFIDEIDAIGSTRKQWEGHTKKTLHQLLVEMDGFEQNEGIILMAATNLPDILDPALTRPGRFDRHIVVPSPDVRGRQEILELYLQDKPLTEDVDIKAIARGTPGFNGADLANLVNIAAIKAAVDGVDKLTSTQLEFAKDRIIMGTERKTMFVSEDSKKLTAYHESGHAIVAIGCILSIQTTLDIEPVEGTVISFDRSSSFLFLRTGRRTCVVNVNFIKDFTYLGREEDPLVVDRSYIYPGGFQDREDASIKQAQVEKDRIGVGVTEEAQSIFDALSKTLPVRWDETVIVVMNEVRVSSPYFSENVSGGTPAANDRVKKVLELVREKLQVAPRGP